MGITHESLLHGIESDYPEKVEEAAHFENLKPPVSEEYLRELCGQDEELLACFDDMIEYFYR